MDDASAALLAGEQRWPLHFISTSVWVPFRLQGLEGARMVNPETPALGRWPHSKLTLRLQSLPAKQEVRCSQQTRVRRFRPVGGVASDPSTFLERKLAYNFQVLGRGG